MVRCEVPEKPLHPIVVREEEGTFLVVACAPVLNTVMMLMPLLH